MKDKLIHFLWRRRTAVFTFGPVLMLLIARPTIGTWLLAFPLIILGEMIRFWAAGHLRKNDTVITSGPYGHVRNPLYVGSFVIFCGLCTMTNRWTIAVVFIPIFILFHWGATLYEEKLLVNVFGEDFTVYKKRVPRLVPRFKSMGEKDRFSFAQACRNREPQSALGTLVIVFLFAASALYGKVDMLGELVKVVKHFIS